MAKLKKRHKILLVAILAGVLLIGAVVSIVLVFAAETQKTSSSIKLSFEATDVAGTISFSHKLGTGEFSQPTTLYFDGTESTSSATFDPEVELTLTRENYYAILKYEITGHAEESFFVSLQYLDKLEADGNNQVEWAIATSELANFDGLNMGVPVGTIIKNSNHADGDTVFLYVKISVNDIVDNLKMNGDFSLVLSREEWADPNYDALTGVHYGKVENNGDPFAVAVGYDGSATDITINTTSVYGVAMPVKTIADWAFATSIATASSTAIEKVTIGENVELVSGYAFAYNTALSEVVVGTWVKKIIPTAFYGCTGLNKITNNSPVDITASKFGLAAGVQIDEPLAMRVEDEMFNGRHYYYVEMGEYPQTYVGAATAVTGLTETQDKFVCDMSTPTSTTATTITENKEYNIWVDAVGNKYIKRTVNPRDTTSHYFYVNGSTPVKDEVAFFKIEPIKWDVVGYYNNDKTIFTKVTDDGFDRNATTDLIVISRTGLQAMPWYPNSRTTDVNYNQSFVYTWLRTFEDNVLSEFKDSKIEQVSNQYMDSSANTSYTGTVMAGSVEEYAWVMDYTQANTLFASNAERRSAPSDFALATFAYQYPGSSYNNITKNASCVSWLRSSYIIDSNYYAGRVYHDGSFSNGTVDYTHYAIRPCVLINL